MLLCTGTIQDYCDGKYNGPLPPERTALFQLADGLQYVHEQSFLHRNIKPDNILISCPSDNSPVHLKISDFRLCKRFDQKGVTMSSVIQGTCRWFAPELLPFLGDNQFGEKESPESDIFALGCVFYFFLTKGVHPFGMKAHLVMSRISREESDLSGGFFSQLFSYFSSSHCCNAHLVSKIF